MSRSRYYPGPRSPHATYVRIYYTKPDRRRDKVLLQKAIKENKEYLPRKHIKEALDWWWWD